MTTTLPSRLSQRLQKLFGPGPMDSLREEMNDLIQRFSADWDGEALSQIKFPSTDVSETDGTIEVKVDVPGMKPEELQIQVRGNRLEISGEHKEEKDEKDKTYHRIERRSGSIRRTLTLPAAVDESKVTAECRDGVLTVILPKTEESKAHRIEVKG